MVELAQQTLYFCDFIRGWNSLVSNKIVHFTVVCLVTWPLSGSEAEVDLVLIKTFLLFICKPCCSHATSLYLHMKSRRVCI